VLGTSPSGKACPDDADPAADINPASAADAAIIANCATGPTRTDSAQANTLSAATNTRWHRPLSHISARGRLYQRRRGHEQGAE